MVQSSAETGIQIIETPGRLPQFWDRSAVFVANLLGLFFGKQLGVFLLCYMAIKLGMAKLPAGAGFGALYGVAILSGVGFTMSLFIDTLAFENLPPDTVFNFDERLGILLGSFASGIVGYIVLDRTLPKAT